MADVLIYGDTVRSPELRHEVPLPIPDPFLYLECNGRKAVAIHSLEIPRVREQTSLEIFPNEKLGADELVKSGKNEHEISVADLSRGDRDHQLLVCVISQSASGNLRGRARRAPTA